MTKKRKPRALTKKERIWLEGRMAAERMFEQIISDPPLKARLDLLIKRAVANERKNKRHG